jgi:hypothetical protein
MKTLLAMCAVVMLAFSAVGVAATQNKAQNAQDKPDRTADTAASERQVDGYKVDYVITETDSGKKVDSRSYTVMVGNRNDKRGSLRIGSRIPVMTQLGSGGPVNAQFQYIDVGVNLDCTINTQPDNTLILYSGVEMSSVAEAQDQRTGTLPPVVRQFKIADNSTIAPGKPTIIGTADDVATHRHFEVQATVTKIGR